MSCAICCEPKRRLHIVCKSCRGDDKKCCLKCHSRLLHTNGTKVEYTCAFCREQMPFDLLKDTALYGSNAWCRATSQLFERVALVAMRDRSNAVDMLDMAIRGYRNLLHDPSDRHRIEGENFMTAHQAFLRFRVQSFENETQALEELARDVRERLQQVPDNS